MGLLTNPFSVMVKLEATKCCHLCDVYVDMEAYDQDQKFL